VFKWFQPYIPRVARSIQPAQALQGLAGSIVQDIERAGISATASLHGGTGLIDSHDVSYLQFQEEVSAARLRVDVLEKSMAEPERQSDQVLRLFQEVSTTIEELEVASEEMRVQNDELLETREQVEAERHRYQELFEFAPDGYLVTDTVGVITEANQAAAEMLGVSPQHIAHKPVALFLADKEKMAFRQRLSALVDGPPATPSQEWDLTMRSRNGAPFEALLTVAVGRGLDGKARSVRWMVRDITRQKRAEGQLRNLHAELEQRVADRTHELVEVNRRLDEANRRLKQAMTETNHRVKNNLQLMAAMVDMQLMDAPATISADELRRLARQISLVAGVHDLLTQSEGEGSPETLSAHAVLSRMLSMVRTTARERQVECCGEDINLPLKQATSLALIVNELVSNALKHCPGDVQVRLSLEGLGVMVEVLDSGDGFPPDFDARSAARTGLDLVGNLVYYDLGGDVRYGAAPGGGGRVEVTFPLRGRHGIERFHGPA
jgi:PAS domain S-box-containing protein